MPVATAPPSFFRRPGLNWASLGLFILPRAKYGRPGQRPVFYILIWAACKRKRPPHWAAVFVTITLKRLINNQGFVAIEELYSFHRVIMEPNRIFYQ